ncbi:MAG: sulfatase-like hydrolase/transferase [Myxococcota bacterium]
MRWPPINAGLLIAVLVVGSWACDSREPAEKTERPNIILVIADDHGYRDFGFLGSDTAITPRLDALAAGATVFTHGYSTASSCRPSLRTLLTGLQPLQFSSRLLRDSHGNSAQAGIQRIATLPRILAAHGYSSFQSGKFWEGTYADAGFDEGMKAVAGKAGWKQSNRILRDGLEPVFDFIDRHRDGPFFVWFAPSLPHIPHNPPSEFLRLYIGGDLPIDVVTYFGAVSWFDAGLGQIIDHLDRIGIRDETLVVYASDNGWEEVTGTGPEPLAPQVASMGGASGKMSLYDPGFLTPLIFDWPGRIPAGRMIGTPVSLADVFPTLLSFAGIKPLPNRDGRDLRSVIEGSQPLEPKALIGMMETVRTDTRSGERIRPSRAMPGGYFYRDDTWHYIQYSTRPAELYRVIDDPDETRNLATQEPQLVARFSA